jgi:GTP-binding protein
MIDDELTGLLKKELPADVRTLFISAVKGQGIVALKDLLWEMLNPADQR